jgi:galactitol-specific phosphotransferase system IIC component
MIVARTNPKRIGIVTAIDAVGLLMCIILYIPANIPIRKIAKSIMAIDFVLNLSEPMIKEKEEGCFFIADKILEYVSG